MIAKTERTEKSRETVVGNAVRDLIDAAEAWGPDEVTNEMLGRAAIALVRALVAKVFDSPYRSEVKDNDRAR